jgi:ABC-type bacteriocin/lantibiotic exporter with double-glycine peptidase domain
VSDPAEREDAKDGDQKVAELRQRFPALRKLGQRLRRRAIPVIQQLNATECGAASLAMVLGYHGRRVAVTEIRDSVGIQRDGADALSLIEAGRAYGLVGRGVKIDVDALQYCPTATILHWEFDHFVVFERLTEEGAIIVDPAIGRRLVPLADLRRSFTGVALLFEPSERFQPGQRGSNHIGRYIRQVLSDRGLLGRIVVTSLLLELFALSGPMLIRTVTDDVLPQGDYDLLWVLIAGMVTLLAFQLVTGFVRSHLFIHLRTVLSVRMAFGFVEHMVSLPYAFFQTRPAGDLLMRLHSNDTIRETLTSTMLSAVLDGMLVLLHLGILLCVSPSFAGLVLILAAAQLVLFLVSRRRQRDLQAEYLQREARAQSYEVELFGGIESLKAMGCEARAVQHWSNLEVDVLNSSVAQARLAAVFEGVEGLLATANTIVPLLFGTFLVLHGKLSLGSMLALEAVAVGFLVPMSKLIATAMELQLLGAYIERINDVLDTAPEQAEGLRPAPRLTGQIKLKNVSFGYGPRAPLVVRDVSVNIQAGQFVALVGPSGAGKSSLASLLLGLHKPSSGAIMFDGVNLEEIDLRSLRRQLGVVTQTHELFGGTIRENIALSDPSLPFEDVERAAKLAQIHDDIVAMPMGYQTPLVDGGASLSGGQRQRLALARALVRRPAILLLDEATSALDAATERKVQAALAQLRCTRVVIAHRLTTVMSADVILVMQNGALVEAGTHEQLLARRGLYASLVGVQVERVPAPPQRIAEEQLGLARAARGGYVYTPPRPGGRR